MNRDERVKITVHPRSSVVSAQRRLYNQVVHSTIPSRAQCAPLVAAGDIDHHVADMTATFSADVTLEAAQARLAEAGQWLAIDGDPTATLGHLVETNSTGPLRLGYGAWRDNLLGLQFQNRREELITVGGRVVKNVAGYDLTRFMVGQFGRFGKIVTLTSRTYRRPQESLLAAFEPKMAILSNLLTTTCRPQWSALTRDALLLGYLGDSTAMDFYQHALKAHSPPEVIRHSTDDDIAARAKLWQMTYPGFRAMLPPSKIEAFVSTLADVTYTADPAFGIVIGSGAFDAAKLESSARDLGGSIILFGADHKCEKFTTDPQIDRLLTELEAVF